MIYTYKINGKTYVMNEGDLKHLMERAYHDWEYNIACPISITDSKKSYNLHQILKYCENLKL